MRRVEVFISLVILVFAAGVTGILNMVAFVEPSTAELKITIIVYDVALAALVIATARNGVRGRDDEKP